MQALDLSGKTYNELKALHREGSSPKGAALWRFRCSCGAEVVLPAGRVARGELRSCGHLGVAYRKSDKGWKKHGESSHSSTSSSTYITWQSMKSRCQNPNNPDYPRYGGRGVVVCERWQVYQNFLDDMGPRPDGHTLDRRENDKGYDKENCRWASAKEQARNRRSSSKLLLTHEGVTKSVYDWADEVGIDSNTLRRRVHLGWSTDRVLRTPKRVPA